MTTLLGRILSSIKGMSERKTQEMYLSEVTSLTRFSKFRYGSTHTSHINESYLKSSNE